ncbi:MAG: hypothetical protein U0031_11635 [Thermomicrobiales bacterium]
MSDPARLGVTKTKTTRRDALKLAGGVALVVFAASSGVAGAQEATPVASPAPGHNLDGKHVVIRFRTVKPDHSPDELMTMIREGFVPLVKDIPGFIWYISGADPETRGQFSIGVFADAAGVAESNRRAAEWGKQGAADLVEGDPTVYEGVIGIAAESSRAAARGDLTGQYAVIRLRQPNPEWPVTEVMARIGEGYVPLIREIPGFVLYFGSADPASGDQAYVGVYGDKTEADESTRIAGEWLTDNAYTFFSGDPQVAAGVIGVAAEGNE